jgi:hypothetical protein
MSTAVIAQTNLSRSSQVMQQLMVEALSRERMRVSEEQRRRELVRRLVVLKRRQRRADSARRAVQLLSVW